MKKLIIGLIALMMISVGFLSGCNEEIYGTTAEITYYDVKDDNGIACFEVMISGSSDLEIVLSKNNEEICSKNIKKRQIDDGSEIVTLEICNNKYETPKGGFYEINVYSGDNKISGTEFFMAGPILEITTLFGKSEELTYSKIKYFNEFTISYTNEGDMPAYVSQIYLDSGKETSYKGVAESSQYIQEKKSVTLSGPIYLETYYYVSGHLNAILLDSNGDALSTSYTWNEP